jgi:O-antigen/teichoic acid export membrane protein
MFKVLLSTSFFVFLAQLVSFFSIPYIGSLSGADQFGIYSQLIGISAVLAVFASLKGEYLYYSVDGADVGTVSVLCFFMVVVTAIIAAMYAMFSQEYLLSLAMWLSVASTIIFDYRLQLNISQGRFNENNIHRLIRAFAFPVFVFTFSKFDTISAQVILISFSLSSLSPLFFVNYINLDVEIVLARLYKIYSSIKLNALAMVPAHFLKQYSLASVFIISSFAGGDTQQMGVYAMLFKFIIAPASIIATAIGEVYRKRLMDSPATAWIFYKKVMMLVVPISLVTATFLHFYGAQLFILIMDETWAGAEIYIPFLLPLLISSICFPPITYTYLVLGLQKKDLTWQIANSIVVTIAVFVGFQFDLYTAVGAYALVYSFMLFLSFLFCVRILRVRQAQ